MTLVYGDNDWSRPTDRQANIGKVPGARHIVLRDTGHFTALEAPDAVAGIFPIGTDEKDPRGSQRGAQLAQRLTGNDFRARSRRRDVEKLVPSRQARLARLCLRES